MKKFIFANWKMNMLKEDIRKWKREFFKVYKESVENKENVEIKIFVPFTHLFYAKKVFSGTEIEIGAQNVFYEEKGAFTGEISPLHLKDLEIKSVIIGHSERRKIFKEDEEILQRKLKKALEQDFEVVFCVGETLEEREKGETEKVIENQILSGFKFLEKKKLNKIKVAYEPVWAIGTGRVATSDQALSAHRFIIKLIKEKFDSEIKVLYGGSITPENFDSLVCFEEISGGLVGGSSLSGDTFAKLVKIALKYTK
ncbi:MAG: triose-phosphate isomerase [Candidatus Hydrothermales bacterium]